MALCLGLLVAPACSSDDAASAKAAAAGPTLHLDHIQVVGTHNSYHLRPKTGGPKDWQYDHAPLDVQAGVLGVRQFELDVHWNADETRFEVRHVNVLDPESNCPLLLGCLQALKAFSDAHPAHVPLWVWIEPKDGSDDVASLGLIAKLEAEIAKVWPKDRRIDPDDVRDDAADLRSAVRDRGWPKLDDVRGRAMFTLLSSGKVRDDYVAAHPTLAGRVLFAEGGVDDAWAAVTKVDDPKGNADKLAAALAAHQLVRTRADSTDEPWAGDTSRREAALASGAQACSTDFPAPVASPPDYHVALPGGVAARCNPVTAPVGCKDADVEP